MSFNVDMAAAARRHLQAADELSKGHRRDVAGYLYGLAAECAAKAMLLDSGWRPAAGLDRRENPLFAHFPELRTLLRDTLQGRKAAPLMTMVSNDGFMSNWSTSMRYSDGRDIHERWISAWAINARQAVGCIGT